MSEAAREDLPPTLDLPDSDRTEALPDVDSTATLPPASPVGPAATQALEEGVSLTSGPGRPASAAQVPGYELLGELGRGGMGVVYKARQVGLNRLVALKMILSAEHASEQERARFQAEAEAVARLQHPHIVQVHDVGEQGGRPFFSLEFCAGGSLASRLDGTPWPARPAAGLVETLARAVQHAHDHGIVHRDLKPANILLQETEARSPRPDANPLSEDLCPKITDFGLAKKLGEAGQTATGAILGTPSYMAPEQAGGQAQEVGPAADVYALGAILYELLTGRPPFKAATPLDTILQVVADEPAAPRSLQSRVPRDLETICLKCLSKEPRRRYTSARLLADDLRAFQDGRPIRARPIGTLGRLARWARRSPAVASLLLAVGVLLVAGTAVSTYFALQARFQAREADRNAGRANADARRAQEQQLTARRHLYAAQMSLAQRAWEDAQFRRLRELLDRQAPDQADGHDFRGFEWSYWDRLCDTAQAAFWRHGTVVSSVAFRPDGRQVASAGWDGTVRVWDPRTGDEHFSLPGNGSSGPAVAYSPDGRLLARAVAGGQITLCDARTGRDVRTLPGSASQITGLAFAPDSRRVAASGDKMVRIWNVKTGSLALTLVHGAGVWGVAFSPDGKQVASAGLDRWAHVWDANTGRPVRSVPHPVAVRGVAFSPDGRLLATTCDDGRPRLWDTGDGRLVRTFSGHENYAFGGMGGLAFSRDSTRLASAGVDWTARVWDVATGRQLHALGGATVAVRCVAFSPDGRLLAAGDDQSARVWELDRTPNVLTLQGNASGIGALAFAADDSRLIAGFRNGAVMAWGPVTGQHEGDEHTTAAAIASLALTADGRRLAVTWRGAQAALTEVSSGKTIVGPMNVLAAVLSTDGRRLASLTADGSVSLWDTSTGIRLHTLPQGQTAGGIPGMAPLRVVALSADGRRVAAGGDGAVVLVWDTDQGTLLRQLNIGSGDEYIAGRAVFALAFSADGERVAVGSYRGVIRLYDVKTGLEQLAISAHGDLVQCLAFSSDGRRLASASGDRTVKLWDTTSGQEVLSFRGLTAAVSALAFSPEGTCLAAGLTDGTARVWTTMPLSAPRLNGSAWEVVRQPGRTAQEYRAALRQADVACQLQPDVAAYQSTLGVAQLRAGRFQEAVATLAQAERLQPGLPVNLAFLSVARQHLGQKEEAAAALARLREVMRQPGWAQDEQARGFLQEAGGS